MIIGEFYGDSDLLLLRCDPESKDYGVVLIALPFDNRSDWYCSVNFEYFITDYVNFEGDKFWEMRTKNNFIEALTRASFLAYPILFIILIMLQRLMLKIKYISHL